MLKFFFVLILFSLELDATVMDLQNKEKSGFEEKLDEINGLQTQPQPSLQSNLELTVLPTGINNKSLPLVFFISGDGGWVSLDQGVSKILTNNGMPVIGLNSRKYFWNEKQPKQVAAEISVAIEFYMKRWERSSFIIVGYSFGACVAPFIVPELAPSLSESLKGVYCFSPDETGDFKVHISDLLNLSTVQKYNVLEQMKKIESWNPVCVFGDGENPDLQDHFSKEGIHVEVLHGAHHYDNNFQAVTDIILKDFPIQKP